MYIVQDNYTDGNSKENRILQTFTLKMTQICIARDTNVLYKYVSSWLQWTYRMSSSKYIRAWCLSSLDYVSGVGQIC